MEQAKVRRQFGAHIYRWRKHRLQLINDSQKTVASRLKSGNSLQFSNEISSQDRVCQANDGEFAVCAAIYTDAWNLAFLEHQRAICVVDIEAEVVDDLILVTIIDQRIIGYISIWEPEWFIHHLYISIP